MSKKSTSKKPAKNSKPRKSSALHETLIKLMSRPNGANAGYKYPAATALKIAERRGFKTNVVKKPGELSRSIARKA